MLDEGEEGRCEHAICLWGIFDSVAECDTYVRSVAGDRVKDHAMHVVSLYEWVRPGRMLDDADVPTHHRARELDSIMKYSRNAQNDVHAFRQWCTENDEEPPVIDVSQAL